MRAAWPMMKDSVAAFVEDGLLSRGASIAFYSVTSIAPVLFIVIAIAGAVFGEDAARGAIVAQLGGLMGRDTAEIVQRAIAHAFAERSGFAATVFGIATLVVTASGVFGEMQSALNTIWHAAPSGTTMSRLIRARLISLGLVAALGFLLLVSLALSTVISALGAYLGGEVPMAMLVLHGLNFAASFALLSVIFAAVYKVLPDISIRWRDVAVGAVATALLFEIGKSLIGFYIGHSAGASAYGTAGSLLVVLLWAYYTAQIFLFGAQFTYVYARRRAGREAGTGHSDCPASPTGH